VAASATPLRRVPVSELMRVPVPPPGGSTLEGIAAAKYYPRRERASAFGHGR
jgi:hypothetical protein